MVWIWCGLLGLLRFIVWIHCLLNKDRLSSHHQYIHQRSILWMVLVGGVVLRFWKVLYHQVWFYWGICEHLGNVVCYGFKVFLQVCRYQGQILYHSILSIVPALVRNQRVVLFQCMQFCQLLKFVLVQLMVLRVFFCMLRQGPFLIGRFWHLSVWVVFHGSGANILR